MKYVLAAFSVVILIVMAIILVASIGPDSTNLQEGKKTVTVTDYIKSGTSVSYQQQGKIQADEKYRSIRITVSDKERKVEVLKGYNESVEKTATFSNTTAAYEAFMYSIADAGFSRERDAKNTDVRGICPLGKRYLFELEKDQEDIVSTWTSSCGGDDRGTFGGNRSLTGRLFQAQIPDYTKFITGVNL